MACILKTPQYWTALEQSGMPEAVFNTFANRFIQEHNRFPNLDEIPGANSTQHLKDTLQLTDSNSALIENIIGATNTNSIEEANIAINDKYADLEVDITPLSKSAVVNITRRPSVNKVPDYNDPVNVDKDPNMGIVFNNIIEKLGRLYGIKMIPVTDKELSKKQWANMPEVKTANAFIFNNDIYINTDIASADAPIHEMTHLLLGSIRFKNPDLYFSTIQQAQNFPSFSQIASINPHKTQSDVLEEAFVQETAKYLAGMPSELDAFGKDFKYELHYNIMRLLDSVFMGDYSAASIKNPYQMSLKELASHLNSTVLSNNFQGSIDDAQLHRRLANVREDLMKKHQVEEICP